MLMHIMTSFIDDFITIYNFLEMALSSMKYKYIINDVIMYSNIIYFLVIFFLT